MELRTKKLRRRRSKVLAYLVPVGAALALLVIGAAIIVASVLAGGR